jgi:hypothetical protein
MVSAKEGQCTGIFNSLVFHTNSAVDCGFAGISDTVSEVSMAMSVTVCRSKFLPFYTPFSSCFTLCKRAQQNSLVLYRQKRIQCVC